MGAGKYEWADLNQPPSIDQHSVAKHKILSDYIQLYVRRLAGNIKQERLRLTLVDGFAGGGLYRTADGKEWPGSPIRMLDAVKAVEGEERARRRKAFALDAKFWFIESNPDTFRFLTRTLQQYGAGTEPSGIQLRCSRFEATVEEVIRDIESRGTARRAIFALDQYGYSDVPTSAIREVLTRLPNAEIILTFATDWLVDYLADTQQFSKILRGIGLSLSAAELLRERANDPASSRRAIQLLLYQDLVAQCGAAFYTPFFIHSNNAHRSYWLIHLSNHFRAKDVMTGLHWELKNQFAHYGRSGLRMLGFDPNLIGARSFFFDDQARTETDEALYEELPRWLSANGNAMSFRSLFEAITNETPATTAIVKETLLKLAFDGVVELRHFDGSRYAPRTTVEDDAILVVPDQKLIVFPGDLS